MITGLHVGDVGTRIFLDCADDLSAATKTEIHAQRPDGAIRIWPATIDGTGLYYLVQAGDINQRGAWRLSAYVEMPGWRGSGDLETMLVD